jgi:glycosyltransferase involved in cell wall biosynthesis
MLLRHTNSMRILFFTENLRAGGKERRIIELLKYLKAAGGFEIELVITKNIIHYEEIHSMGIPIHLIERKGVKKDPRLFFMFYRIAKKFRPDIIHVWGHMVAVYAVPTKILLRVPMINNEIADATLNQKLIGSKLVFKHSDRVIANTHAGLKAYNAPKEKSTVIYNGFTFNRVKQLPEEKIIRERFNIKTPFVVAMVASFLDYKDYDTYIRAALLVLARRKDVSFLCIGDGEDSQYKEMVPAELTQHVLFLGRQSNVESIMNVCAVGVLATNIKFHGEGISNALMEFMALRKPVITTNFGGSVELVENNVNGFLVDAFNVGQLAEKVDFLLENKGERQRLGENAHELVKRKFSMEAMFESFKQEYQNILKKTASA